MIPVDKETLGDLKTVNTDKQKAQRKKKCISILILLVILSAIIIPIVVVSAGATHDTPPGPAPPAPRGLNPFKVDQSKIVNTGATSSGVLDYT